MRRDAGPLLPTTAATRRAAALAFFVVLLLLAFFFDARLAHAKTFTVNSTGDDGDDFPPDTTCDSDPTAAVRCTLREAIDSANELRGADTIKFDIPTTEPNCSATTNVCTIFAASGMPQITDPLTIDGYSQGKGTPDTADDAKPNTLAEGNDAILKIELKSVTGVGAGLWISAKKSTVKGLIINSWEEGVRISGSGATANKVMGNFIGTDFSGTVTDPNGTPNSGDELGNTFGVSIVEAPKNTVGGTTPGARNVISGSDQSGVSIGFAGTEGNQVMGNYIGTDKNGTADLGNFVRGVFVFGGAANNIVGGTKATMRNVISGNNQEGVRISTDAVGNKVMGNFIGTKANGTEALGNGEDGVLISAPDNTVGGTTAGARNVISGSDQNGVTISGADAEFNQVMGNYIGTKANGIEVLGNVVRGVGIEDAPNNTIGGTTAGARNVISGNGAGVRIRGSGATGNQLMGNFIGTDASGTLDRGNDAYGVSIQVNASNNTIGGTTARARNIISGNDDRGVLVAPGAAGNRILSNSIHDNSSLGIDLSGGTEDASRVTANDGGDLDAGPNGLQNFPVLSSASKTGKKTTIEGTLNSTASTTFTIQFFSSLEVDDSDHGEGQKFLGQISVTTNANGDVNGSDGFTATTPVVQAGHVVTATATNETTGDTSEFSEAIFAS